MSSFLNTAGNLEKIPGNVTVGLQQTPPVPGPEQRLYTYTLVWDPAAPVQTGNVLVTALGVDAQGDAVSATGVNVVIVP